MLSGIQHFQFCKRQWALIHIEQQWEENSKTVEGNFLHSKADNPFVREKRKDRLIVRGMPVKSSKMRVSGICDVVEFVKDIGGVELAGENGKYQAYPVEYKRGKPKVDDADILQLTAQAMCIEEMLLCEITTGYLFYNEIKHRVEVPLTDSHKEKVKDIFSEMHNLYQKRYTPKVKTGPHCSSCSLENICVPRLMNKRTVRSYIEGKLSE